jgi:hypothetical protein
MRLGKIFKDGTIRDMNNMRVGTIEKDGTIRDKNNMRLGTVSSDGTIRDNNNMRLGTLSLIIFCTINPINLVKYLLFKYKLCLSV